MDDFEKIEKLRECVIKNFYKYYDALPPKEQNCSGYIKLLQQVAKDCDTDDATVFNFVNEEGNNTISEYVYCDRETRQLKCK